MDENSGTHVGLAEELTASIIVSWKRSDEISVCDSDDILDYIQSNHPDLLQSVEESGVVSLQEEVWSQISQREGADSDLEGIATIVKTLQDEQVARYCPQLVEAVENALQTIQSG